MVKYMVEHDKHNKQSNHSSFHILLLENLTMQIVPFLINSILEKQTNLLQNVIKSLIKLVKHTLSLFTVILRMSFCDFSHVCLSIQQTN